MRYRERPFSLYARKIGKQHIWYYYTYDAKGKRYDRSTGQGFAKEEGRARTRRAAEAYCMQLFKNDSLRPTSGKLTLDQWAEGMHFWDWRRSRYVRAILSRSPKDKPGIKEDYVRNAARIYAARIQPHHGGMPIASITPSDCEDLLFAWQASGAEHKTVNNWRSVASAMMAEAARLQVIPANPWRQAPQLAVQSKQRGGFTIAEGVALCSLQDVDNPVFFLATKTAFMCGLRAGEVCGLQASDIKSRTVGNVTMHYIEVSKQYSPKLRRLVPTKDNSVRAVPILAQLYEELEPLLQHGGYVFSFHPRHETPITANRMREWMYRQLPRIGISDEQRIERNLTFHSARRFFNTLLRRRVSSDVLRKMTGHDSDEMTEHYTDYLPDDLAAISEAQRSLVAP